MRNWTRILIALAAASVAGAHTVTPSEMTLFYPGASGVIRIQNSGDEVGCTTVVSITVNPASALQVTPLSTTYTGSSFDFAVTALRVENAFVTVDWSASQGTCGASAAPIVRVTVLAAPTIPGIALPAASNPNTGVVADPVSTATGELYGFDRMADLSLGGPLPLRFRRYYGSLLKGNNVASALGDNWMHNFDVKLATAAETATVTLFRGKTVKFNRSGAAWQLAASERRPYQLVTQGADFRFLDPAANLIYTFNAAGALTRIEDRNGNALTVTPAAGGVGPERVADGLGRTLAFTYAGARLTRVQDQTGRAVSFEYTGTLLTAFTDGAGKRAIYNYTSAGSTTGLMTSEVRPAGNRPYTQEFDQSGRVSRQLDSRANATRLDYTASATTVTQPQGVSETHAHDAQRSLTRLTDATTQATTFSYDANDRRTGRTNRLGDRASSAYHEASGMPASITDEQGNTTTFTYAAQAQGPFTFHNPTRIGYPDGTAVAFTYDNAGNVLTVTDQAGKITRATFNQRGQVETLTNPAAGVTTYAYGSDGTLTSVRTDSGDTTTLSYDANKRLTEIRHPDASLRRLLYDGVDNLAIVTDERGFNEGVIRDDNHNVSIANDALSATLRLAYDGDDRLITATDPLGKIARFTYDANGRLQTLTDQAGNRATYAYDTLHRVTSIVDAAGKGLTFAYDREGRLAAATDSLGRAWRFTVDKVGRVTRITTPQGQILDTVYDANGRITSMTNPLAQTTRFRYDARGLPIAVDAPAGLSAAFEHNDLGLTARITDPNGSIWGRGYDKMGRLTSLTDPLTRVTGYAYDSRSRLARVTLPSGNAMFTYDPAGNPTRVVYSDATDLSFGYDNVDRLVSASGLTLAYDAAGRIVTSNGLRVDRDDAGRISAITYAAGKVVRYTYDTRGLLATVTDWVGGTTTMAWDDAAQIASITYPNGARQEFTYDSNGRSTGTQVRRGTATLAALAFRRDAAGKITSADRTAPPPPDVPGGSLPLAFDAAHQVIGYTYDALGRVTSDGIQNYSWDLASRLKSYSGADGAATFTYDALSQRISRTSGGATENYVLNYAHPAPALAVVRASAADQRYYVYLPDGTLLASVEATGNARRFYHFDETGSTMLLTDDAGNVSDSYSFTPYGETIARTGSSNNPFTWQGAFGVMQEGVTPLYYMRFRYYDSASARFLSPDPVLSLDLKGINPYQYAFANPMTFSDPLGLAPTTTNAMHWRYVETMYRRGYTKGCSDTGDAQRRFCPGQTLAQGEMSVFIIRAKMNSVFPTVTSGTFARTQMANWAVQSQMDDSAITSYLNSTGGLFCSFADVTCPANVSTTWGNGSFYAPMHDTPANVIQYGSVSPVNVLPFLEKLFVGTTSPPITLPVTPLPSASCYPGLFDIRCGEDAYDTSQAYRHPVTGALTEVPQTHPYYNFIQKLRELRITNGTSLGGSAPPAPAGESTRQQLNTFLVRAFFP